MSDQTILHFSDWNRQDKYYQAPKRLIGHLGRRIKSGGVDAAWSWWITHVDYDQDKPDLPVRFGIVDMRLPVVFLDYEDPVTCVDEWED